MSIRQILPCLFFLMFAGCASNAGDFPTLAKRPIESRGDGPVAAAPAATPAPAVDQAAASRINAAIARAEEGIAEFERALPPAQSAVGSAKGAAYGSEGWINAQMTVSALERTRGPLKTALTELDEEARLIAESGSEDRSVLIAQARLAATDARQNLVIEELLGQLSSR